MANARIASLLAAAVLAARPGPALAASVPSGLESAGLAVGGVLLVALGAGAAYLWLRRRLAAGERDRAGLKQILGAVSAGLDAEGAFLLWRGDEPPRASPGLDALGLRPGDRGDALAALLRRLRADDREALGECVAGLRRDGTAFDRTVRLAEGGRVLRAVGRRHGTGVAACDLLLLRDATEAAGAAGERDRMATLLDSLPLPVWSRADDLRLTYCNAAYARALDLGREEAVARGAELASGAIAESGRALARRARDLRLPQSESQHMVLGGSLKLYDFAEQPLPGGGLAGYARDLTALESTQAELSHHIAAHAEVLEHLGTGIVIFGQDERVKFFNAAYLTQFGLDEAFLRGEPTMGEVFEALRERRHLPEHADFPAYKRALVRRLMGVINPLEELVHLPTGSTLRMVAAPHPFGGVLITYEDVTDTLALERSYNTLIEVQRETLDNLYEGVAVYGGDGRLKLSNPAFARLWGLDPAAMRNEPHVREIVDLARGYFPASPDWPGQRDRIIAHVAGREARTGRMERPDGSVLDYAAVPLPDGACLFTYLDVTDSARVERALRERNAALETADRLKSEFIANVSYELRTPLNAIIGFAELLDLQYFGTLNERQLEYSRGIVEASQRLLSLINDILDIASIEAGYLQLDREPVDIRALLKKLHTIAAERARNRNLKLTVQSSPGIGSILADERRLKQAIYNLISNAVNFTPAGGRITVSARREDGAVLFSVVDTGIGIAPEDQALVFEKFARGRPGQEGGGVGLGLSLVKSLIEMHGGTIAIDSAPGAGTRVTCRIPDAAAEPAREGAPS